MTDQRRVHFIPPKPVKREKRVGIYCRVSSNSMEQLNSLTTQVSALTRLTASSPNWLLVDTYIDIASGKAKSNRKAFNRLIKDCEANNIEIIITKNISRFGRDTVEVLEGLNKLKELGVRDIFEQEGLDTADTGLTGRKLMVDTYGGFTTHGGGAFSGKDPTKVDRSGAYMARHIAKHIVWCEYAEKCEVSISYAIGKANPVAFSIDTFGTGNVPDSILEQAALDVFNLKPAAIIEYQQLRDVHYADTAVYGHFDSWFVYCY